MGDKNDNLPYKALIIVSRQSIRVRQIIKNETFVDNVNYVFTFKTYN